MEDNIKLYLTPQDFMRNETNDGDYYYLINGHKRKNAFEVTNGDIASYYGKLEDQHTSTPAVLWGTNVTATTLVDKDNNEYYGVLDSQINPGSNDYWHVCTGSTSNLNQISQGDIISGLSETKLYFAKSEWQSGIILPLTGGIICTYDSSSDLNMYQKIFTDTGEKVQWEKYGYLYTGNVLVCENGVTVYGVSGISYDDPNTITYDLNYDDMSGNVSYVGTAEKYEVKKTYSSGLRKTWPSVAYVESTHEVFYNYIYPELYKVTAVYNVTTTSEPTNIAYSIRGCTEKAVLDGNIVLWDDTPDYYIHCDDGCSFIDVNLMESAYTFSTTGLHTIEFYVNDKNLTFGGSSYANFYSFSGCPLVSVELGEGIETTCTMPSDTPLSSITLPHSIKNLSYICDSLSVVNYNGSVAEWVQLNFSGWSFFTQSQTTYLYCNGVLQDDVTIPGSVVATKENCFKYCSTVTALTFENGVVSAAGFEDMYALETLTLPPSLTYFKFQNCSGLTSVTWPSGSTATKIPDDAFDYTRALTSITIPDTIVTIGQHAFRYTALPNITIPSSVETLGYEAFQGSSLTSVTIPSTVKTISGGCFYGCWSLSSITLNEGLESIGELAFSSTKIKTLTIPGSCRSIGYEACSSCTTLTDLTFIEGQNTLYMPSKMYCYCTNINNLIIPQNVTTSSGNSYSPSWQGKVKSSCTIDSNDLVNLKTWDSGNNMYHSLSSVLGFSGIRSIVLGEHVTNIPNYTFTNLSSLSEVHCRKTTPPTVNTYSFRNVKSNGILYVPTGCSSAYSTFKSFLGSTWTIVEE